MARTGGVQLQSPVGQALYTTESDLELYFPCITIPLYDCGIFHGVI